MTLEFPGTTPRYSLATFTKTDHAWTDPCITTTAMVYSIFAAICRERIMLTANFLARRCYPL
jgi:hypothetical protein